MRNRSLYRRLWYSFAFTGAALVTAAVGAAQEEKKTLPETKVPETKEPGAEVPGVADPQALAPKPEGKVEGKAEPVPLPAVPAVPAVPAADAAAPRYGRVVGKEVKVLCFASQRSPVYEDVLREGDVVMVGKESGEFLQVVLPLGVVGYVHKDFTTAPVEGVISTTRPRVSFRYRPQAGEAPIQLLEQGARLRYLAAQEGWWKVRMVPEGAWVGIKDVQVFREASPTLVKSYDALRTVHDNQCVAAAAEFAKADAEAKLRQAQVQRLEELRKQVQAAATLADAQQLEKLTELANSVKDLEAEMPADTTPKVSAGLLAADIKSRHLATAARLLLAEKPKPATDVMPGSRLAAAAPFTRFVATGWLRFDRHADGHLQCRLEKGKKAVAYVTCSSGRFDLALFDGVEVGIRGDETSAGLQMAPIIDAVRLEVLTVTPD